MVWGGGTFDAISRLRAMQGSRSGRGHVHVPRKLLGGDGERDREPFACFQLCGNCGYLGDERGHDPYREPEQGAGRRKPPCPSCAADAWLDLGDVDVAYALRKAEAEDRMLPSRGAKLLTILTVLSLGLVGALVVGLAIGELIRPEGGGQLLGRYGPVLPLYLRVAGIELAFAPLSSIFASTFVTFTVYHAFKQRLFALFHRRRETRPDRWRLPLPLPERRSQQTSRVEGVIRARGPLLRAPISGRECVGYEVSVLFDAEGDARRPMWVLEEEHMAEFELEGRIVPRGAATLELPLAAIELDEQRIESEELNTFLRKRGLFGSEGSFEFFEALVLPGRRYALIEHEQPAGAVAVLEPAR